jgi:hypothetical protein
MKIKFVIVALLVLVGSACYAATTDYAVGTCLPKLHSYSTISAAVAAVPSGSIVEVCPGTYAEQVTISKPLTLEGITSENSAQAVIAIPSGGLAGSGLVAQVTVTAGPVNITNITVDGTNNNLNGNPTLAGIYYSPGSSGTIKFVTTQFQLNEGNGLGILGNGESLTIENCSIHDFDFAGIEVSDSAPSTVNQNYVNVVSATGLVTGIIVENTASLIGNTISGPGNSVDSQGIVVDSESATITNNTFTNWLYGIVDYGGAKYTSNTIRNTGVGILLGSTGATVDSNVITQAVYDGIEFGCNTNSVKGNTLNNMAIGIEGIPASVTSTNTYYNVQEIRDNCGAPTSAALQAVRPMPPARVPVVR